MNNDALNNPDAILFFDGVCNLCNQWVDYTIRHDHKADIKFASLQSEYAQNTLSNLGLDPLDMDTVILILKDQVYKKSRVAGHVFILLGGWHAIIGRLILLVPRMIADSLYNLIARNRYRIYGKSATCRIPSPEERARFLE